jgi:L-alanine-DL-glutamate epimerase-like enolase superfamily enzyme
MMPWGEALYPTARIHFTPADRPIAIASLIRGEVLSPPLLRAAPLELELARPFTISRGSKETARNVLVEIEHASLTGRGEAAPNPRYGQSQESVLLALDEFDPPAEAFEQLDPLPLLEAFSQQFPADIAARAALEIALWDWAGKRLGRPLHRLLAIDPSRMPVSSYTISIDTPELTASRVHEAAAWPVFKLKLGGGDFDYQAVAALRQATSKPFRVDANEAWDEAEAVAKIAWLAEQGCELVEQPLPAGRLDAVRRLRESSPIPLVADEDAPDLMALDALAGVYDGVNVKLMKCGGVRDAVQMIHAARSRGLSIMLGCMIESSLGISAAVHLSPLARWADLDAPALLAADPFVGLELVNGRLEMPVRPGLGVEPRFTTDP